MRYLIGIAVAVAMTLYVQGGVPLNPDTPPVDGDDVICKGCSGPVCYRSTDDCRRYVVCEAQGTRGIQRQNYIATYVTCAFGTFFDEANKTCDVPENARCKKDRCREKNMVIYDHELDSNCRTHWVCNSKGYSEAMCCPRQSRYDPTEGRCIADRTCNADCPRRQDACANVSVEKAPANVENCRIYWDCKEGGSPHPVCCPSDMAFDVEKNDCVESQCADTCPDQYKQDMCKTEGVVRFEFVDQMCRTHMVCGKDGGKDVRTCCISGEIFDSKLQNCRQKTAQEMNSTSCSDECPSGYDEVCPLPSVPSDKRKYILGGQEMSCSPGSIFSVDVCTCIHSDTTTEDNACSMALDISFSYPLILRSGSQRYTFLSSDGKPNKGEPFGEAPAYFFNGSYSLAMDYTNQKLTELFLRIVFYPKPEANSAAMVLITNCRQLDNKPATFSVMLDAQNIVIRASTDMGDPTALTLDMQPGRWNDLYVLYNGLKLEGLNRVDGFRDSIGSVDLKGAIKLSLYPFNLGGCKDDLAAGNFFRGDVAKLQWSQCLKNSFMPSEPANPGPGPGPN